MTLEEMREHMEQRNKMIEEVLSDKKPVCPNCKKGHVLHTGRYYIYCDNPDCEMKIVREPKRNE